MNIGDVIASIRRRKRIDQKIFAELINTSPSYLSQIENNRKKPSIKLLKVIAEKLQVPLSILIYATLEEKYFPDEKGKELFNTVKPIMEELIEMLDS